MLGFSLSEEQNIMKETITKLVKGNVIDTIHEMDEKGEIDNKVIQKAWELGASISPVPEEYGGYGMEYSPVMNSIIIEELSAGDMSFALYALLPSLFLYPVVDEGTKEQKEKYLPLYCKEAFTPCTAAINEPSIGFDPVELKTTALKKNGSYILEGKKCFVPLADASMHMLVAASLEGRNELFIVSRDNPGVKIGEREKNLGLYCLPTYEVELEKCEIPAEDRLGGEKGCNYDKFLQKTRIAMAAVGTGISRVSYEYARGYALERQQFGEPIAYKQTIAFRIAEMAYEVEAMRLLTWRAASILEAGKDAKREAYLAKMYAGEMTMKITDWGVQTLGGHGYIREHPVERYYRNGRGISILEGMAIV